MPVTFNEENNGKILVIHVSGKLKKSDYESFIPELDRLISQHGKLSLLFDMTDFHGWELSALWEDAKAGIKHFHDINKLAMVGEKKWQQSITNFSKPFTKAQLKYFDHADIAEARKWLMEV